MWRNLRDVRSMAEKITSVVAPPPRPDDDDDDDEEEYSGEEGDEYYEDYEEEDIVDEEDSENNADHQNSTQQQPNQFSIVGMLSRALDSDKRGQPEEGNGLDDDDDDDDDETVEEIDFQEQHAQTQTDSTAVEQVARMTLPDPETVPATTTKSAVVEKEEGLPSSPPPPPPPRPSNLLDATKGSSSYASSVRSLEEPPRLLSLVRESGSVSPQRHRKPSIAAAHNLSVRSLGSTPCGNEVTLSPLKQHIVLLDNLPTSSSHSTTTTTAAPETTTTTNAVPQQVVLEENSNNVPNLPKLDPLLGSVEENFSSPLTNVHSQQQQQQRTDNVVLSHHHQDHQQQEATTVNVYHHHPKNNITLAHNNKNDGDDKQRGTKRVDSGILPQKMIVAASSSSLDNNGGRLSSTRPSSMPSISLTVMDEGDEDGIEDMSSGREASESHTTTTDSRVIDSQNGGIGTDFVQRNELPLHSEAAERQLRERCAALEKELAFANSEVTGLRQQLTNYEQTNHTNTASTHLEQNESAAAFIIQRHEEEIKALRNSYDDKIASLQRQIADERSSFQNDFETMNARLTDAINRSNAIERQAMDEKRMSEKSASQLEQQQSRARRSAEEKLVQTMALLDERDETVTQLKEMIQLLESKMTEQKAGVLDAEKEMAALDTENDDLHNQVESLQAECNELRKKAKKLEGDSEKLVHLKMELRMLKEDHNREKAKVQTVAASAESSSAQLEAERDVALARVQDLQLQLSAALADVGVAKSDAERVATANSNLQYALEAFQNEREAEMAMLEETRQAQETALTAAHAAVLDATHEAHAAEIRQIQRASDAAVTHSMDEIKRLEEKLEMLRVENVQTRRSLDEAIRRLQATQDDVIDRSFMKNVLLDWLTKTDRKEKSQVLELMANILHFTEAEKEQVHIDEGSTLRKLVAPPPSKVDVEKLEGDNVREKWVNFLIAETED